ncbi:MoaD/ThiS family protein [Trebonia sp.]|uniref:MoaD/ThiS family protein n=1 Tax=Trebonia sp. TaxID=2767075 RepID=UPI002611F754|nr:MoaD/ThiS family protein [Trebonia sp.]
MAKVTIRYWAAAKDAAGVPEETVDAASLADALAAAAAAARPETGSRLRDILARSSFLVNANPVGRAAKESVILDDGAVIEVLPPFAGG